MLKSISLLSEASSQFSGTGLLPRIPVALIGAVLVLGVVCMADDARGGRSCRDSSDPSSAAATPIESPDASSARRHKVRLSWDPSIPSSSKSMDAVQGYNIYRREVDGEADGKFEQINKVLIRETSCTDYSVAAGHTYAYEVQAVSTMGAVSKPSSVATATVPSR